MEDPANAAPDDIWMLTKSPKEAPDKSVDVTIGFEPGRPVSVNGKKSLRGRAARRTEPHRLRARHRPHRSGGKPLRRHEIAGLLRNAWRHSHYGRSQGTGGAHASQGSRALQSKNSRSITPNWSTTDYGSPLCANRWTRSSKKPANRARARSPSVCTKEPSSRSAASLRIRSIRSTSPASPWAPNTISATRAASST